MIKISANVSKKVPIPGMEFSSQQFGAAMEIEVSDADKPDAIHARIADLYALLSNSIDAQITGASQQASNGFSGPVVNVASARSLPMPAQTQPMPQTPRNGYSNGRNRVASVNGSSNGNGRRVNATEAQCRAIFAICKSQGVNMADVLADFNVGDPKDLHVKDASRLIDDLKSRQASNDSGH
ncbi:MAG: hypothetical protein WCT04_09685 [Planctomycetota bacterium]